MKFSIKDFFIFCAVQATFKISFFQFRKHHLGLSSFQIMKALILFEFQIMCLLFKINDPGYLILKGPL